MKRKLIPTVTIALALGLMSASAAYCWGDTYRKSAVILQQTFPVKLKGGGQGSASITYKVEVADVIQEGQGNFGRNCQFVPSARTFIRSVEISAPGAASIQIADAVYKEPLGGRREFNDPCGDHASGDVSDFSRFQDENIGNVQTWSTQISEDRDVLRKSIGLVGEILF